MANTATSTVHCAPFCRSQSARARLSPSPAVSVRSLFGSGANAIGIQGSRYLYSGKMLHALRPFMERVAGLDLSKSSVPQKQPQPIPPSNIHAEFMSAIQGKYVRFSTNDDERLFHAHGHTCQEIYQVSARGRGRGHER